MKKLFFVLMISLFILTACSSKNEDAEFNSKYELVKAEVKHDINYSEFTKEDYLTFKKKLENFSFQLTEALYQESKGNFVVSPVSIYMALAMCVECSNNGTKNELLNALGMTYDEVLKYTKYIYNSLNQSRSVENNLGVEKQMYVSNLSNSIWIDEAIDLKEECLKVLSKEYHLSSYKVPFLRNNKVANSEITKYVKTKTRGLIDSDFNLSKETVFTLINTYYLKDTWNLEGDDSKMTSSKYQFTSYDNEEIFEKFLLRGYYSGKALETTTYTSFYTNTQNGITIKFILPKDGYTIDEVFTKENLEYIAEDEYIFQDHELKEEYYTRCLFPEFTASFDKDIIDPLKKNFQINDLFNFDTCDFTNITDMVVACQQFIHKAKLEVNRKGIEAAAVTVVGMNGTAAPIDPVYKKVYLDFIVEKAFGYVIEKDNGIVLFSGVIKTI